MIVEKLSDTDPEPRETESKISEDFFDPSKNRTSEAAVFRVVSIYFVLRKLIEECSLKDILEKVYAGLDHVIWGCFRSGCLFDHKQKTMQCSTIRIYIQPSAFYGKDETRRFNRIRFLNSVPDDQSTRGFLNIHGRVT